MTKNPNHNSEPRRQSPRRFYTGIDDARIENQGEVGPAAFGVYCGLARHADTLGHCYPSIRRLASYLRCNERTVIRAIASLESTGWICVERRNGAGNQYTITPTQTTDTSVTLRKHSEVNPGRTPKRAGRKTAAEIADIPPKLDTAKFHEAWAEWLAYRKAARKTLTPQTAAKQLKKLAGWGEATAVDAIENSITQGWQGLFEPKESQNGSKSGSMGGTVRQTRSVARVSQRYEPQRPDPPSDATCA